MVNNTRLARNKRASSRKNKLPGSGSVSGSGSGSGSVSGDTSGLRRSIRKDSNSNSSPASARKSPRLEKQVTPTKALAKKKTMLISTLRRSERENKFQFPTSKQSEKDSTPSKGLKQQKGSNSSISKEVDAKSKGVPVKGNKNAKVGTKRKVSDARLYQKLFKSQKKKSKASDSLRKRISENCDNSGDSGSEKVVEAEKEHSDGEELKEDCGMNLDCNTDISISEVRNNLCVEKPCECVDGESMQISVTGNIPSLASPRAQSSKDSDKDEDMQANCSMTENIHTQEVHLASNKLSDDDNGSRCNLKEMTPDASNEDIDVLKERLSSFIVSASFLEYWVPVQISNLQLEHYCSSILSNSGGLRSSSKSDPVGTLRETLISIRKCCDHPYIADPLLKISLTKGLSPAAVLDLEIRASGKLQLLSELLSQLRNQKMKVLILFQSSGGSGRIATGDFLDDLLQLQFGVNSYERIDSGCLPSKKHTAVDKFNKETERSFFLLETRASSPSIKLSTVDAVIIFDSNWNPHNDMRALQKITIESKIEQIKVFRLYCSCTVEEKVLILAKNDMLLDSTLQGISPSTSHMLLMWGSSYLFTRLDEFHRDTVPDSRDIIVPGNSFLKDVCQEILSLVQNPGKIYSCKFISVARRKGGSYLKNTHLIGEQKIHLEDGVPPHVFWNKLLEGKQFQWKYLSNSSQRNRKRVQYFDESPMPSESQAVKKRKKIDSTKLDSSSQQVGANQEKSNDGDYQENYGILPKNNSKSMANIKTSSYSNNSPTLPTDTNSIPGAHVAKIVEGDGKEMHNEQRGLFEMLKPTILSLCETLLLKDDVKRLAERFLEYVVNTYRVTREPETILQAFQISVCWAAGAVLNQIIDHKKSLAVAAVNMNFNCREDEADFIYSKMKLLMSKFLDYSKDFTIPESSTDRSATINGIKSRLRENSVEDLTVKLEESPAGVDCLDEQVSPVDKFDKERYIMRHFKKVKKKCDKQMEMLKVKQKEECEKFEKFWKDRRAKLDRDHRVESAVIRSIHGKSSVGVDKLKILDSDYAKKRKDLESQISISCKELEARQQNERVEEIKKTERLLAQVKSLEHGEHSNGTADITGKILDEQNSDIETSETREPKKATSVCEVARNIDNTVTSEVSTSEHVSDSRVQEVSRKQPPDTSRETEKETNQMDSVGVDTAFVPLQVNGVGTSLICESSDPLPSPVHSLTEQPTEDPVGLLISQGLGDEPCQRLVDGEAEDCQRLVDGEAEEQGRTSTVGRADPMPSDLPHNEGTSTSCEYNQTGDGLRGRIDDEPSEIHTPVQGTFGSTQQELNSASTFGVANPTDASRPNPVQASAPPNSRFSPPFSLDALQNESDRICIEINGIINGHEETKLRLKAECLKEMEEIRRKYDVKIEEAEASFSLRKRELEMTQNVVLLNKMLAKALRSQRVVFGLPGMQQERLPRLLPATRPPSATTASFSAVPSAISPCSTGHQQVSYEVHATAPHLPPSCSVLSQQPPGDMSAPQVPPRPPHPPVLPPQTVPNFHDGSHLAETVGRTSPLDPSLFAIESYLRGQSSAVQLVEENLRGLASNSPILPDDVQDYELLGIFRLGREANFGVPSSNLGAGDVVCLSDDD